MELTFSIEKFRLQNNLLNFLIILKTLIQELFKNI